MDDLIEEIGQNPMYWGSTATYLMKFQKGDSISTEDLVEQLMIDVDPNIDYVVREGRKIRIRDHVKCFYEFDKILNAEDGDENENFNTKNEINIYNFVEFMKCYATEQKSEQNSEEDN